MNDNANPRCYSEARQRLPAESRSGSRPEVLPVRIGSCSGAPQFDWAWAPVLEGVGSAYISHY